MFCPLRIRKPRSGVPCARVFLPAHYESSSTTHHRLQARSRIHAARTSLFEGFGVSGGGLTTRYLASVDIVTSICAPASMALARTAARDRNHVEQFGLGHDTARAAKALVLVDQFFTKCGCILHSSSDRSPLALASIAAHRSIRASNGSLTSSSMPSANIFA